VFSRFEFGKLDQDGDGAMETDGDLIE
jgi:hypothetical protein